MIALAAALAVAAGLQVRWTSRAEDADEPRERRTLLDGSVRLSRDGMVVTGDSARWSSSPPTRAAAPQRKARRRGRDEPALLVAKLERFTSTGTCTCSAASARRTARTACSRQGPDAGAHRRGKDDPVMRDGPRP